jgi:hypothetical protein
MWKILEWSKMESTQDIAGMGAAGGILGKYEKVLALVEAARCDPEPPVRAVLRS